MSSKNRITATKEDAGPALVPKLRFPEFRAAAGWHSGPLKDSLSSISNGLALEQGSGTSGYRVTRIETISAGTIDLAKVGLIQTSEDITAYRLRIGDILLSNINSVAHIGKSVFVDRDYDLYHGMNLLRLEVNRKQHDPKFIFYAINTDWIRASLRERANKAVNQASINQTELGKTEVCLPHIPEQQKIAECLSSMDELMDAQARKVNAIKIHKKGLMQQLFPLEGETQPRLRFPEFRNAGGWSEGRLADIATVLQGYGFPERHQGQKGGDYPFYKVSDISRSLATGKVFIEESANYINEILLKELRAKPIPEGTTVFAKIGEAIRSNRRAITTVPCLIDNNAAGVKRIKGKATDMFIYLLMEQISLIDHAGGVVPAVNKSAIEEITVKFPEPDEQERIASCMSSLDALITAETQKFEAFKTHKKGLMQQLFQSPEEVDA